MPDPVQDVDASSPFRRGRRGAHHHLEEGGPRGANDSAIEATEVRSPVSLPTIPIYPLSQYLHSPPLIGRDPLLAYAVLFLSYP